MKKYIIQFNNNTTRNMVLIEDASTPQQEVSKWEDQVYNVSNIVSIQEVQEFP